MKDKKKVEILLKVTQRVCTKNPGMQKLIDKQMIDICQKEGMSPKQTFFAVFAVGVIIMDYLNIFDCKGQAVKILGVIFTVNLEKKHKEFFDAGILRV